MIYELLTPNVNALLLPVTILKLKVTIWRAGELKYVKITLADCQLVRAPIIVLANFSKSK